VLKQTLSIPSELTEIKTKENKEIKLVPFVGIYNVDDKVEFLSLMKIDPEEKEEPVNLMYEIETQMPI
jgi:hypothetical protein